MASWCTRQLPKVSSLGKEKTQKGNWLYDTIYTPVSKRQNYAEREHIWECQTLEVGRYQSGIQEALRQRKLWFRDERLSSNPMNQDGSPRHRGTAQTRLQGKRGRQPEHMGIRGALPGASQSQSNSFLLSLTSWFPLISLRMEFKWQSPVRLAWKWTVIFFKVGFYAKRLILIFLTHKRIHFISWQNHLQGRAHLLTKPDNRCATISALWFL